jgi:hypothetical protein
MMMEGPAARCSSEVATVAARVREALELADGEQRGWSCSRGKCQRHGWRRQRRQMQGRRRKHVTNIGWGHALTPHIDICIRSNYHSNIVSQKITL